MTMTETRDAVCYILFVAGVLTIIAVLTLAILGGMKASKSYEDKRDAFFSECIERHLEGRCKEFWRYNRTDLGRK